MLVLTRKLMEKLYIGDNICVTVVRLEGGQVRLGIEAPREVAVCPCAELVPCLQSPGDKGSASKARYGLSSSRVSRTDQTRFRGRDNRRRGRFRWSGPAFLSFFRKLLMCTSMVRSSTMASSPIAASISS